MFLVSEELFYSLEGFLLDKFNQSSPGAVSLTEAGVNAASFYDFFHHVCFELKLANASMGFADAVNAIMSQDDLVEQFSVDFLIDCSGDDPDNIENWVRRLEDQINQQYKANYKIQEHFQSYLKNRHGLEGISKVSQLSAEVRATVISELFNHAQVVSSWQDYRGKNSTSSFYNSEQSSVISAHFNPDSTKSFIL